MLKKIIFIFIALFIFSCARVEEETFKPMQTKAEETKLAIENEKEEIVSEQKKESTDKIVESKIVQESEEVRPKDVNAYVHYELGKQYHSEGDLVKAIEEFNQVIQIDANIVGAWVHLGHIYCDLKDYEKAFEMANKAIELAPERSSTHNILARVYANKKMYNEAIKEYQKVIELKPNYPMVYNNLAKIYMDQRKYHDAIKLLEKSVKLDPTNAVVWNNLGVSRMNLGQYTKAKEAFQKALEQDPNYKKASLNLIWIQDKIKE
jgi:tetratricopeptide (TPR) repeat protein